jgi:hypothetical protein
MNNPLCLAVRVCCAATLAFSSAACIINVDSNVHRTGRVVGEETMRQLEPGRDESFVLALLGEPTRRIPVDGGELWKWESTETRTEEGRLIFLYSGERVDTTTRSAWVEFKDKQIVRSWRD